MGNVEPLPDFSINQRIGILIEHLRKKPSSFADSIDKSPTVINQILSNRNKPSFDLLKAILLAYPLVNANWLMRGEGPMVVDESGIGVDTPTAKGKSEASIEWASKLIDQLERENKRLWSIIETAGLGKQGNVSRARVAFFFFVSFGCNFGYMMLS